MTEPRERMSDEIKVGDTVHVLPDVNRHGGGEFVVAAIGRKYIKIQHGRRERKFDRVTGQEQSCGAGGYCYLLSMAAYADHVRRREALAQIRRVTRAYNWERQFSTQVLEGLARLLEQAAGDGGGR